MSVPLFLLCLAVSFLVFLAWCSARLPKERWQVFAAIPIAKSSNGEWKGLNITFYGFFNGVAGAVGAASMLLMLGAINFSSTLSIVIAMTVLGIGIPASRVVARCVENKKFTFTSNGAMFVSLISLPWIISMLNKFTSQPPVARIPILPVMAACAVAYAYGESLGRMACISFGCCYGKRVDTQPRFLQKIVMPFSFSFEGGTKKAAYEGGMEGIPLIPIQAITSVFCFLIALIGTWLYFHSLFATAFVVTIAATQVWRFVSESLRADYRGNGKVTAYQAMALAMIAYSFGLAVILPAQTGLIVSLQRGLRVLWNPAVLIFLEFLWGGVFLYYGRSKVTGSTLSFHIHTDRI